MILRWSLCGILIWLGACASPPAPSKKESQDPSYAQDARACRSEVGLDGAGRNNPQAYRLQALYNRCMRYRGWSGE